MVTPWPLFAPQTLVPGIRELHIVREVHVHRQRQQVAPQGGAAGAGSTKPHISRQQEEQSRFLEISENTLKEQKDQTVFALFLVSYGGKIFSGLPLRIAYQICVLQI